MEGRMNIHMDILFMSRAWLISLQTSSNPQCPAKRRERNCHLPRRAAGQESTGTVLSTGMGKKGGRKVCFHGTDPQNSAYLLLCSEHRE